MFEQLEGNWGTFPWKFKNFGCPKGSILHHYFSSWLKIISAIRESIDTDLMNRVVEYLAFM